MRILRVIFSVVLVLSLFACTSRNSNSEESQQVSPSNSEDGIAVLSFETSVNDLGTINEGEQVIARFTYHNGGDTPLIIQNIEAGCGCTVPSWNTKPLPPGEEESIKVVFNSRGKNGAQNIRVSVYSNARNAQEELRIRANVISNL